MKTNLGRRVLYPCGLMLLLFLTAAGCAGMRMKANPEYKACLDDCMKEKNACMLKAFDVKEIDQCDKGYAGCTAPCYKIPELIPAEQNK